ncbi:MAG TPA: hypothetical protein VMS17_12345 [Gemmataceae bacterium]|nr:hypothetical protein [Gemmataceae bacterium]
MRATKLWAAVLALGLAAAARAGDWQTIPLDQVTKDKPGFGGLSGVVVDRDTGDVYVCVSDIGVFRSDDKGKTWKRLAFFSDKGRTEQPGCMLIDPRGGAGRLLLARVYGGAVEMVNMAHTSDRITVDGKSSHVDWCAIDWTDAKPNLILALKHESGGTLIVSRDGGKTFDEIGKGYGPAYIFDKDTAVVAEAKTKDKLKPGLLRTTDGAKTFQPCGDYAATALPKFRDGALYWLTDGGLIRTTDAGKTWEKLGDVKDARYGPIFGKDAKQMFVLTGAGVVESSDGGATWSKPVAPPPELKGVSPLTWIEYDPVNDVVYIMKMGSDLYWMEHGKK